MLPAAPRELGKYAVWTGSEYLGGPAGCCDDLGGTDVFGYSPTRRTWRTLAAFPLGLRQGEATVWSGREMIVVGGREARSATDTAASDAVPTATGAALDPVTNTWRTIAPMPAAGPFTAVWTGRTMVVFDATHLFRYDPRADHWTVGAPPPFWRNGMTVVRIGRELALWAGASEPFGFPAASQPAAVHGDGAVYNPVADAWRAIPTAPVPARMASNGVWTGHQLIVWGGFGSDGPTGVGDRGPLSKGAAYDPTTNTWRRMQPAPPSPPSLLTAFSAFWTGDVALFVGGADQNVQGIGPLGLSDAPGR